MNDDDKESNMLKLVEKQRGKENFNVWRADIIKVLKLKRIYDPKWVAAEAKDDDDGASQPVKKEVSVKLESTDKSSRHDAPVIDEYKTGYHEGSVLHRGIH